MRSKILKKLYKKTVTVSLLALIMGVGLGTLAMAQTVTQNQETAKPAPEQEIIVRAKRLNAAQMSIQPDIGASTYSVPQGLISSLPGGDNASISDVILQTPGTAQDSFGQLHIRGDHDNIQYRLNGIILPEGLSSFGQVLSPRYAQSIDLSTGALPAQYGLRTAGVINITTQNHISNGGDISLYGGSHGDIEPSLTYGGSNTDDTYFASVSYRTSQLGVEAPNNTSTPLHDRTEQTLGFGYYDHIIDGSSRISLMAGVSDQHFQIPNMPNLTSAANGQGYSVDGQSSFASNDINSFQHEATQFVIASYLKSIGDVNLNLAVYARNSRLTYTPDILPELAFNGIAQYADRQDQAFGLQAEGAWTIDKANTIRSGLIIGTDHSNSSTNSAVLLVDSNGAPVSDQPTYIADQSTSDQKIYSFYLQDEWKPIDSFVLNYGLRYDLLEAYRKENQTSPRVNFVWTIDTGLTMHGGYSRYFTPPPFELISTDAQAKLANSTGAINGANSLPYAERDHYFDLGIQKQFNKNFSMGLDSYYRMATRLIDEGQFGAPIILTPFNYQNGRNQGVEFTTNYTKGPFSTYFNFAVAHAMGKNVITSQFNFSPADLAYISDHYIHVDHDQTYTSSTGFTYKWGQTKLSMDAIYGSGLRKAGGGVPNGSTMNPYTQINLAVSEHFGDTKGFDLRFDVINLFDDAYEIRDGSGIGVGAPQWGPRRGLFVGISKAL